MGYFNASAQGHFEVEGVAAGVYDIYAEAAGYPAQLVASQVTILPGQSFHLDIYLNPGPVVHGQIYSKHLFGEEPWPSNPRPVYVELYGANDYADSSVRAFSPLNLTTRPSWRTIGILTKVRQNGDRSQAHAQHLHRSIQRPRRFWLSNTQTCSLPMVRSKCGLGWIVLQPILPLTNLRTMPTIMTQCNAVEPNDLCGKQNGVGPAQYWWVDGAGAFTNGGGANSFIYRFGVKGVYGAPTDFDGHVPQALATWVNGLTAGRYWVRAWINGYTQTLQDGQTLDEYYFDVAQGMGWRRFHAHGPASQ